MLVTLTTIVVVVIRSLILVRILLGDLCRTAVCVHACTNLVVVTALTRCLHQLWDLWRTQVYTTEGILDCIFLSRTFFILDTAGYS